MGNRRGLARLALKFLRANVTRPRVKFPAPSSSVASSGGAVARPAAGESGGFTPGAAGPVLRPPAGVGAPAAAPKIDWNTLPEVQVLTTADLERTRQEVERGRWRETWEAMRLVAALGAVVVLLALGYSLAQQLLNRRPSDALLASIGQQVGAELLRRHGSEQQPLEFAEASARLLAIDDDGRATYELVVTLRAREALYAPASTNGAQAYLDLQRAVADAQAKLVQARLYSARPDLATPPMLPPLLMQTHRAGERREFVVPLDCAQRPWSWRVVPRFDQLTERTAPFTGQVLAMQPARFLSFGTVEGRAQMRRLQQEARDYVLAVQRALVTAGR